MLFCAAIVFNGNIAAGNESSPIVSSAGAAGNPEIHANGNTLKTIALSSIFGSDPFKAHGMHFDQSRQCLYLAATLMKPVDGGDSSPFFHIEKYFPETGRHESYIFPDFNYRNDFNRRGQSATFISTADEADLILISNVVYSNAVIISNHNLISGTISENLIARGDRYIVDARRIPDTGASSAIIGIYGRYFEYAGDMNGVLAMDISSATKRIMGIIRRGANIYALGMEVREGVFHQLFLNFLDDNEADVVHDFALGGGNIFPLRNGKIGIFLNSNPADALNEPSVYVFDPLSGAMEIALTLPLNAPAALPADAVPLPDPGGALIAAAANWSIGDAFNPEKVINLHHVSDDGALAKTISIPDNGMFLSDITAAASDNQVFFTLSYDDTISMPGRIIHLNDPFWHVMKRWAKWKEPALYRCPDGQSRNKALHNVAYFSQRRVSHSIISPFRSHDACAGIWSGMVAFSIAMRFVSKSVFA